MSQEHPAKPSPFKAHTPQVDQFEREIASLREQLSKAQREGARIEGVRAYEFQELNGERSTLADLFGTHNDLLLIHNMGERCLYCALWADGLSALASHMEQRAAFVLATPDAIESAREQVQARGWRMRVVSDAGSPFADDMGFEGEVDARGVIRLPGVSAFHRNKDGRIDRVSAATFGPGDTFCAIWPLFDLLPEGVRGFAPLSAAAMRQATQSAARLPSTKTM